jgi:hypothetical protein
MLCDWLWYNYICLPIKKFDFVDDKLYYPQNNNQQLLNTFCFCYDFMPVVIVGIH